MPRSGEAFVGERGGEPDEQVRRRGVEDAVAGRTGIHPDGLHQATLPHAGLADEDDVDVPTNEMGVDPSHRQIDQ